ncbi:MAG: hypothetical protein H0X37_25325 [Herpetosiphonaceae bacterium]|nr:hypothetical protein [Herpetosiphonaceae bacterium]
MNESVEPPPSYVGHQRRAEAVSQPPPPGHMALMLAGLAIGILLMGIQLWLLTIALDLYLGGAGNQVWLIALVSGTIFLGGLLMLRLLRRRPRVRRGSIEEGRR